MSTQFINSLNALTAGTAMSFKAISQSSTNPECDVFLFSNQDTRDQVCHAKLYFRSVNGNVTVAAQLCDTYLYANSPNLSKYFEYLSNAVQLVKQVMSSSEIHEEYRRHAEAVTEVASKKYNKKVAELSKTHVLLNGESAKSMLESYIELIRKMKADSNKCHHFAVKDFRLLTLNNDSSVVSKTLTINLDKRISLFLKSEGISKADLLTHMVGTWAPKLA